jgi:hypothetical protein
MKNLSYAAAWLRLLFNNETWSNLAGGLEGTSSAGYLYVSLHSADPSTIPSQNTNEASYTGYSRQAVARTTDGWTVTNNVVSNAATISFGVCTANGQTITHVGIGTGTGETLTLYSFPLVSEWKDFQGVSGQTSFETNENNLVTGDIVQVIPTILSSLPTPLEKGVNYYIVSTTTGLIQLSTTLNGSPITITASGYGMLGKISPIVVDLNVEPVFASGKLTITEE